MGGRMLAPVDGGSDVSTNWQQNVNPHLSGMGAPIESTVWESSGS